MNNFESEEINAGNKIISHFIENCTQDFNSSDWREFKSRHDLFSKQFAFGLVKIITKELLLMLESLLIGFATK